MDGFLQNLWMLFTLVMVSPFWDGARFCSCFSVWYCKLSQNHCRYPGSIGVVLCEVKWWRFVTLFFDLSENCENCWRSLYSCFRIDTAACQYPACNWRGSLPRQLHSGFYLSKRWWGGSRISWTICKSFTPQGRMPFLSPNQQRWSTEGTVLFHIR